MTHRVKLSSRRTRSLVIANFLILTLAVTAAVAQQSSEPVSQPADNLPSADEILGKFVKAMGGEKALRRYTSSHTTAEFSVPSQGMKGILDIYAKAPNKTLTVIEIAHRMGGPEILVHLMDSYRAIRHEFFPVIS